MADGVNHGVNRGLKAPDFNHQPQLKPTIYKTVDDQVIVEDEFLNFLAVKIKSVAQDEIVLIASSTFDSEWIESSKKLLFELCPDTKQRCVAFKGSQKDANNIKSCLKVLNECGENIPHFVSHYLDELPPVTFNSLDVSSLLSKVERLHSERVAALERRLERNHGGGLVASGDTGATHGSDGPAGEKDVELVKDVSVPGSSAAGVSTCVDTVAASSVTVNPGGAGAESPKWSRVVKQGRARRNNAEGKSALLKQHAEKSVRRLPRPIVGIAAQGRIKVVHTKLVSVFTTKFSPDLDAEKLSDYLAEQLGREVICQRIVTVSNRYSSFKVCAECNDVSEMCNSDLWPEGSVVTRYYKPRKAGEMGASRAGSIRGASVPSGATAAQLNFMQVGSYNRHGAAHGQQRRRQESTCSGGQLAAKL
ncbi:hypothetical protein ABVT39_018298 [Epinephelus coioides]